MYYIILFFIFFLVMAIGSSFVSSGVFCRGTAPGLYSMALFICVIWWLIFFGILVYVIKLKYGAFIFAQVQSAMKEKSAIEIEEVIFKKEFMKIDTGKTYYMQADDVPLFFTNMGLPLPPDEVKRIIKEVFFPDADGKIDYYKMLHWFREFTAKQDADYGDDDLGEDDVVEFDAPDKKKKKKGSSKEKEEVQLVDLKGDKKKVGKDGKI
jgi:hypothetical protein